MVKHGETKGRIVSSFRLVELVVMLSFDKFYQILCFSRGRLERCQLRSFATKKDGDPLEPATMARACVVLC